MRRRFVVWFVVAALAGPPVAWSGEAGTGREERAPTGRAADEAFLTECVRGTSSQLALAKLARGRSRNGAIEGFADRLMTDQECAGEAARLYARTLCMDLPARPDDRVAGDVERLQRLSGETFDRAWIEAVVGELDRHVAALEARSPRVSDPELATWGALRLKRDKDHRAMAHDIARALHVTIEPS